MRMTFLSHEPDIEFTKPMMGIVIASTMLSTVPGVSAAGPSPEATTLTPNLDAELIVNGAITSMPIIPVSPSGCATPATLTRAMMELTGVEPIIVNAGLKHTPPVPCVDVYGECGNDPRTEDAVPKAEELFKKGISIGKAWSNYSDLLVLGESVPGGTTTALCVLKALGYESEVSSSFIDNPSTLKTEICTAVLERIKNDGITAPLDIIRYAGDPMMPVVAGIVKGYKGKVVLAGGTQLLSVAALLERMGEELPAIVTTTYVYNDNSASFIKTAEEIGITAWCVDPDFGNIGNAGLARYCEGEVKEGVGAGGALWLARVMGHSKEEISEKLLDFLKDYS